MFDLWLATIIAGPTILLAFVIYLRWEYHVEIKIFWRKHIIDDNPGPVPQCGTCNWGECTNCQYLPNADDHPTKVNSF